MDITILEKTRLDTNRYYFKISVNSKETVELWGILNNVLVTRKYRPDIEDIIYELNHSHTWQKNYFEGYYFYPLRYFIKDTKQKYEDEIREWVITGKNDRIKKIELEYPTYIYYNKEDNVMIPLCYCDWITNNYDEFKQIIINNFGELALTSTYALVNKWCIQRQVHYLWFVKDYSQRYLLLEDSGIYPDQLESIHNTFNFTCPVCHDKTTPAGIAELPRPFYSANKELLATGSFDTFKIEISDPCVKLENYEKVKCIMDCISTSINPIKISFHQYQKVAINPSLTGSTYPDYVKMAKECNIEYILPWSIHSQRQLTSLHDSLVQEYNLRKNTSSVELKQKYLELKKNYPKFEYSSKEFIIQYPKDIDDLSYEGTVLHHCVGSYKSRVLSGVDIIIFLRETCNPDHPFVTMQLKKIGTTYNLVQAHGCCNCSIKTIDGVYDFVIEWCKQMNISVENIDLII